MRNEIAFTSSREEILAINDQNLNAISMANNLQYIQNMQNMLNMQNIQNTQNMQKDNSFTQTIQPKRFSNSHIILKFLSFNQSKPKSSNRGINLN